MNKALDYDHGKREFKIQIQASVSKSAVAQACIYLAGRFEYALGERSLIGAQGGERKKLSEKRAETNSLAVFNLPNGLTNY